MKSLFVFKKAEFHIVKILLLNYYYSSLQFIVDTYSNQKGNQLGFEVHQNMKIFIKNKIVGSNLSSSQI
jgi:hypothetical protein